MPSFLNAMTRQIPSSSIHAATQKAEAYRREGKKVVIFSIGRPDFDTPQVIKDAAYDSIRRGNVFYTSNYGTPELRKAIAEKLKRDNNVDYTADEILVTIGVGEGTYAAVAAFLNPGDQVLVPDPVWLNYIHVPNFFGAVPVSYKLREENDFQIDLKELESLITDKTRMLVINTPGNPTGVVQSYETLKGLADMAIRHDLIVVSDEIYAELTYGQRHVSPANLTQLYDRTVVVNGFSKTYAMTGWRLGYACGPEPIIKIMTKIHQSAIMSAPTTSQYAAITALKECDGEIDRMRDEYNMRRRLVVKSFNDMGLTCFEPRGAFYAFPCIKSTGMSSQDFCTKLLEQKHVAIIPGDAFGASGEGYARISYAYSVEHLKEALRRIREFLQENGIYHGI